jgi:hypothetical protein
MRSLLAALFIVLASTLPASAQSFGDHARSLAVAVLTDPTTYTPAVATEVGKSLDWNSSQRFFAAGYVEDNPFYTITGLPHDRPISRGAGARLNLQVSLRVLGTSIANNAVAGVATRALAARWPEHRRLIRMASIVERAAFAFGTAYVNSAKNYRQWRKNVHTPIVTSPAW